MKPFLAQARRGDRAFARLYRRHVGDVYRYALVLLRNPEDAERVTQTTFLNAYRVFGRGERPANTRAWLLALAHNVCRQRVRAPTADLDEDEVVRAVPDPAPPTPADIRRAVDRLPFDQRAALVMRELEGRSYAEIAEVLQLPPSTVETLVFEARHSLREQLEGALSCHQAERAISLHVDGRLPRSERRHLRAHLRECAECAGFAQSQRAQRSAWKTLASVPLPASLQSFFGPGGVLTSARSAAGGIGVGVLVETLVIVAIAAVAVGLGHESKRGETPNESARAPSPPLASAAARPARRARPADRSAPAARARTLAKPRPRARSQAAPILAVSSINATSPSSERSRGVNRTRPTAFTVRARANPKAPGHEHTAGGSPEPEPGPKQTAPAVAAPAPPAAAPPPAPPPPVAPLELPALPAVPPVVPPILP